ncbi:Ig-like domain-containing protein [Corynebacterium cystitidis]|uniref:Ig-like domain-containing protein n=1 Tax=Corynebacterium cystitidis TaxID=35757 RepID=UPI00211F35E5|nr:Ig-like domain-containing protein [Corynebacterium cystitidis]
MASTQKFNIYCDIATSTRPTASNQQGDYICSYSAPGTYSIAVTGDYPHVAFGDETILGYENSYKLMSVDQWGNNEWLSMRRMFYDAKNFNKIPDPAVEIPNTSSVTDMSWMFYEASAFNQPIGGWDTSKVTDMSRMFLSARAFNQPIGGWDTSKVTNMLGMFVGASAFNQPIGGWDVSSVKDMSQMFYAASSFNQPLDDWDTSRVENMGEVFWMSPFDHPIGNWSLKSLKPLPRQPDGPLHAFHLLPATMSTCNYDATLRGWAQNPDTPDNVLLNKESSDASGFTYTDKASRDALIAKGWILGNDTYVEGVDCTLPDAPTGLTVSEDGTTLTGKAEAGSKIEVKDQAGESLGTATADQDGNFTISLSEAQTNGQELTVTATGADGNVSEPAVVTAPRVQDEANGETGEETVPTGLTVSEDGTTLTGRAEAGSKVEVKNQAGEILGNATADQDGNFTISLSEAQTNGQELTVTATDADGNVSEPATVTAPRVQDEANGETGEETVPTGLAVSEDGTTLTGKAEAGSKVEAKNQAGEILGNATADQDGNFTISLSEAQTNGQELTVTATDADGNVSEPATVTAPRVQEENADSLSGGAPTATVAKVEVDKQKDKTASSDQLADTGFNLFALFSGALGLAGAGAAAAARIRR